MSAPRHPPAAEDAEIALSLTSAEVEAIEAIIAFHEMDGFAEAELASIKAKIEAAK